jgi:hypothetical protein
MDPAGSVITWSSGSGSVIQDYGAKDPDLGPVKKYSRIHNTAI